MPLKTRPLGVSPNPLCVVSCQKSFPTDVKCKGARPPMARTTCIPERSRRRVRYTRLSPLAHTQIDGSSQLVQFSHRRDGGIPHVEATFDEIAELQQTHA